jgi:hypothetical protein
MSVSGVKLRLVEGGKFVVQPLDHVGSVADPKALQAGRDF